jgi:hypothetical protein
MSGMIFKGQTIQNQPAAQWKAVYNECRKYPRFVVEVREYSEETEISDQQRKWLHCDNGPVRQLMAEGWSFIDAKNHLKRAYGRQWFVKYISEKNFKTVTGEAWWECQAALCNTLIHPVNIGYKDGKRSCPLCGNHKIKLIAIQSIMDKSVKTINLWFDEIFNAMPRLPKPDPNWKQKNKSTSP